jgi:hypothetical protein
MNISRLNGLELLVVMKLQMKTVQTLTLFLMLLTMLAVELY